VKRLEDLLRQQLFERDWRPVCEISNMEPIYATLRADIAAPVLQVSTVPKDLLVLGAETGLPALPMFYINFHLPKTGAGEVAIEPARHIRWQFAARHHRAA